MALHKNEPKRILYKIQGVPKIAFLFYDNTNLFWFLSLVFEEVLSLEIRIAIIFWKLGDKTYEDACQLYHRKYGKQ